MKISAIIPVYNAEDYLAKCLDSVLGQSLHDLEVICIDDCSSDNSYKLLKSYAEKDSRIKCFRNEVNIGQGLTRNRGLDLAKGEYIAFVDCDDWIELNMYETLYAKSLVSKYDLICCNLILDFPDGTVGIPKMPENELITKDFLIKEGIAPSIKFFSPNSPCDKIYKREAIENLNLRFESERVLLYEDKVFNLQFLASETSFVFVQKTLYHYVVRHGSTMTSYRKNFIDRYFIMDKAVKSLLTETGRLNSDFNDRLNKSLFEITFVFCLNALIYNKSLKGKFLDFWKLINDKRISTNTKKFKVTDIAESSSMINALVKSTCFYILKYLR